MADPFRVLIVDDSSFMRSALKRNIEMDSRFTVVATAADGEEGVRKVLELKPDIVTLDVEMPVMNGIAALQQIVAKTSVPVIMVSAVTDKGAKTTIRALEIGAVDFVPKAKGAEHIHDKLLAAVNANPARAKVALTRPPVRSPIIPASPVSRPGLRPLIQAMVVIIGSSTGGPQALQTVLGQIPANFPLPIVIAQHMPAQFTLALAKRLDGTCPLKVVEAKDRDPLAAGMVYIGPGGMHIRVSPSAIRIQPDKGESLYKPSVNVLAESAQEAFGKNVLGIMLTGMGNDGMRAFVGLQRIGGYNIVQDANTSVVYGMPRAVVDAGGASEVLPVERIGLRLRDVFCA